MTNSSVLAGKGGGDAETWATGGLRRWPDDGEEDMLGSSKLNIVLCIKSRCNPDNRTCYCCQTIPKRVLGLLPQPAATTRRLPAPCAGAIIQH
nr:unnamed protein product [Digitaria exilis]